MGSSPHTRGPHTSLGRFIGPSRIIPAYAGSTILAYSSLTLSRDHPRIRGVHASMRFMSLSISGSSPHTRGPLHRVEPCSVVGRIIPAYAGSTSCMDAPGSLSWDHPRIRGVHEEATEKGCKLAGSSPHTRGPPERDYIQPVGIGTIPAYAGSTLTTLEMPGLCRDHPRIRGVHPAPPVWSMSMTGSSPHTRGPLRLRRQLTGNIGIIPAYAGSTKKPRRRGVSWQDHPRIRGVHPRRVSPPLIHSGSSPHTRGPH